MRRFFVLRPFINRFGKADDEFVTEVPFTEQWKPDNGPRMWNEVIDLLLRSFVNRFDKLDDEFVTELPFTEQWQSENGPMMSQFILQMITMR